MKTYYSLILAVVVSFMATAQKKELKAAQKQVDSGAYKQALVSLEAAEPLIENAEAKYASYYYYLLGVVKQKNKDFDQAISAYEKAKSIEKAANLKKYTTLINNGKNQFINELIDSGVKLNGEGKYKAASTLFFIAYNLDKTNNLDYLYYAASTAVNAEAYDDALNYYNTLKDANYTGITTKYYATEVATDKQIEVSQTEYNIYKKSKDYKNLREEPTPSRLPEIVKNIALIYVTKGDNDAAMAAIKDARSFSPKDVGLILTEADLYIKLGDEARFGELMQEAIEQDPNNALLYYNLGVVVGNQGKREEAIDYYKKAIELDPSYEATYLNLASLILEGESSIVEQMNALGTSAADNRKYDELKSKREGLFLEAVPYLEQLVNINPKNRDAITTLKNIFGTIGDTANFKKYRDMLDAL